MKHSFCLAAAILLVAGCSSVSVSRDYDPSFDFSKLHTYAWHHETQPKTGDPRIDNDLMDERIRDAVDAKLVEKGFVRAQEQDADFLLAYYMTYKQRISGNTVSFGVGGGDYWNYGGVGYNTTISDYDEGQLTIDIIDPTTGKTIWRSVGVRATYEGSSPEAMTKIVNSAVSRILAKFPPAKK